MSPPRTPEVVGRVLGGRYRLLAPIGSGASAQVYLADDEKLARKVAVKVLHPLLAEEVAFSSRFEAEARATAALSHPNLVAVFDWGDDDGPYLVTEYLAGGSLRSMLDAGHRLSVSQALLVGLEAARGLAHAHAHGVVHRDVKPANLLFGEDGRLRIADFGVARAVAEAALTEAQGITPGTVRYASPEQAHGRDVGPEGDVYALALVLVESVTGEVPLVTDTAVGTLMARAVRPLEVDPALGPLAGVLERAGRLDPAGRPDALALAGELLEAASQLPAPAALPLVGTGVAVPDTDPTLVPPVRTAPVVPPTDPPTRVAVEPVAPVWVPGPPEGPGAPPAIFDQERVEPDRSFVVPPRRRRWPWVLLVVVLLAVAGSLAAALLWRASQPVTHEVPELIGLHEAELDRLVEGTGWIVERQEDRRDGTEPGEIIDQEPPPGEQLEEGGTLLVTVSLGPTLAPVPTELVGLPRAEAEERILAAGFVVGEVSEAHSEDVPAGHVLSVPELPAELPRGTPIDLVVSAGPEPRMVPELAGRAAEEAEAELRALGLVPVRVDEPSEEVEEGRVVRSEPGAGASAARDSEVVVVVSSGPPFVDVPEVEGMTPAEAADALEAEGLEVEGTRGPPNQPARGTDPPAGTSVRKGSAVTILTGPARGGEASDED